MSCWQEAGFMSMSELPCCNPSARSDISHALGLIDQRLRNCISLSIQHRANCTYISAGPGPVFLKSYANESENSTDVFGALQRWRGQTQRIRIVSNCNSIFISTYICSFCSCRCLHNFTNTRILFLAFGCDFFAMLFQPNPHISLQHQHQHHLSSFSY
ncbi:hypothetical protein ACLKA6_011859 [Drosophila palustris]